MIKSPDESCCKPSKLTVTALPLATVPGVVKTMSEVTIPDVRAGFDGIGPPAATPCAVSALAKKESANAKKIHPIGRGASDRLLSLFLLTPTVMRIPIPCKYMLKLVLTKCSEVA
jgi:hypothetical protein